MQVDRATQQTIAALSRLPNFRDEAEFAARLKRYVSVDDIESFRSVRNLYFAERIAQRIAKNQKSGQITKADRDQAMAIVVTPHRERSDEQRRAYGAAREAFSHLCAKYEIRTLETSGGIRNKSGIRERPAIDKKAAELLLLPPTERAKRVESYVAQKVQRSVEMIKELKRSLPRRSMANLTEAQDLLQRALDHLEE